MLSQQIPDLTSPPGFYLNRSQPESATEKSRIFTLQGKVIQGSLKKIPAQLPEACCCLQADEAPAVFGEAAGLFKELACDVWEDGGHELIPSEPGDSHSNIPSFPSRPQNPNLRL